MFDFDLSPILLAYLQLYCDDDGTPPCSSKASSKVRESPPFPSFPRLPRTHRVPVIGSALMSVIRPSGVWCPVC
jgi:hypothetical protein